MAAHVSSLCCICYFQLQQLRPVVRSLSAEAANSLVQAFISCRLDYCNAMFYGISDTLFGRLQSVQNAAARLSTGGLRRDHISPVLKQLHWLPVRCRVAYKLAVLVFKSLYLAEECQLIADDAERCRLRSTNANVCIVPRNSTRMGDRRFCVARPRVWNSLPSAVRQPDMDFGGQFQATIEDIF